MKHIFSLQSLAEESKEQAYFHTKTPVSTSSKHGGVVKKDKATKRGDMMRILVCNVNGLVREMGGRALRDAVYVSERL